MKRSAGGTGGQLTPYTYLARLSEVEPSGMNPRRDFGGIDELADAIRATGGEPVNPMVVVRDGNRYRIVDGERRYRALRRIYADEPDHEVSVLVFREYADAAEAVAMLATDSKERLTDDERATGYQMVLRLDVPAEDISLLSGVDAERVSRARTVARDLGERLDGTGFDLLDLARMAELGLDEGETEAVLAAKSPRDRLDRIQIERRLEGERRRARELCEERGIEYRERRRKGDEPDAWAYGGPDDLARRLDALAAEGREPAAVFAKASGYDGWGIALSADGSGEGSRPLFDRAIDVRDDLRSAARSICRDLMERLVERHEERAEGFVPAVLVDFAWDDRGLPIQLTGTVPELLGIGPDLLGRLEGMLGDERPTLGECVGVVLTYMWRSDFWTVWGGSQHLGLSRDDGDMEFLRVAAEAARELGCLNRSAWDAVEAADGELRAMADELADAEGGEGERGDPA